MKILIKTVGFIGDILFASSVAEKLKNKYGFDTQVDYCIGLPQPLELLNNNPFINEVFLGMEEPPKGYDKRYLLQPINRQSTPCEQFQKQCEIEDISPDYKIYTNPGLDTWVKSIMDKPEGSILVAVMQNWEERTFLFTKEEYEKGIDIPNLGYGGKHRNINKIIDGLQLNKKIIPIGVGKPNGINSMNIDHNSVSEYSFTASILKNCDYFIGAEGGLANLAAGVGTKTIITGDFIHQLYGWNGVIEKCSEPKLGPKYYFHNQGHVTLDPYLTDEEVIDELNKLLI